MSLQARGFAPSPFGKFAINCILLISELVVKYNSTETADSRQNLTRCRFAGFPVDLWGNPVDLWGD